MASPQKEEGYTPVAHEILEQIAKANLNGTQFRIIIIVWRFTYGFQRKMHKFSLTFLAEALEAHKNQIQREMQTLIERNILIVVSGGSKKSRVILYNKNHETWLEEKQRISGQIKKQQKQLISGQSDNGLAVNLTTNPLTKIYNRKSLKKEVIYIEEKIKFLDTVYLTQAEYDRLIETFGIEMVELYIEKLDEWQTNFPKKQKVDHNKTIRVWIRNDAAKKKQYGNKQLSQNEKLMQEIKEDSKREQGRGKKALLDNQ